MSRRPDRWNALGAVRNETTRLKDTLACIQAFHGSCDGAVASHRDQAEQTLLHTPYSSSSPSRLITRVGWAVACAGMPASNGSYQMPHRPSFCGASTSHS